MGKASSLGMGLFRAQTFSKHSVGIHGALSQELYDSQVIQN